MTPWDTFKTLDAAKLAAAMRGKVVVDPYRLLDASKLPKTTRHIVLGKAGEHA